tara:strand:+ start:313 stop:522 length:210 start_codon:yes stop_codon:yes gene_type:complete
VWKIIIQSEAINVSHTVACGRSKKKRCKCKCGGKLHGKLVKEKRRIKPEIEQLSEKQLNRMFGEKRVLN